MQIFLSYASEDKNVAEPIAFSLRGRGHKVFFDKDDLPAAESYDDQIAKAIEDSDFFIFLISPESVSKGRYALTELGFARQKWPIAHRNILPVMLKQVEWSTIPNYLKAVTLLQPEGNIAAEVSNAITRLGRGAKLRVVLPIMAIAGLVSGSIGGLLPNWLPSIGTDSSSGPPLFILTDALAPIHVALLFSIAICSALWYWERPSPWAMIVVTLAIFAGWLVAHNSYRLLVSADPFAASQAEVPGKGSDNLQNLLESVRLLTGLGYGMLAGMIGALFTWLGAQFATRRMRMMGTLGLTVIVGGIVGTLIHPAITTGMVSKEPDKYFFLVFGLWQMAVAVAIGYGLSRELR